MIDPLRMLMVLPVIVTGLLSRIVALPWVEITELFTTVTVPPTVSVAVKITAPEWTEGSLAVSSPEASVDKIAPSRVIFFPTPVIAPPSPVRTADVSIVELVITNGPFVVVSATEPLSPPAKKVLALMVVFVMVRLSLAVMDTVPALPAK